MTTTPPASSTTKSGMRALKPGEILFNEGEYAFSLYIIQKGQIRLFKPKGKGFVELGVLRTGEVIGEMAFFDEDGTGRKRSCSASAITPVEVIEISFTAFGKTMSSLNPWFKTIINTLVTRLRKTNIKVKELEDNQASVGYGGKHSGYEFMKPIEVMRTLGTLFLVFKAHGESKQGGLAINRKTLLLYTSDMYQIMEVKLESILSVLTELKWIEVVDDEEKLPNLLILKNVDVLRQIFIFYNSERHLDDSKKLRVSEKSEILFSKMIDKVMSNPLVDIPNLKIIDDIPPKFVKYYLLNPVLDEFKSKNISINPDHLDDGKNMGFIGELVIKDGSTFIEIDFPKMQKLFPVIRFMNGIRKKNAEKDPTAASS